MAPQREREEAVEKVQASAVAGGEHGKPAALGDIKQTRVFSLDKRQLRRSMRDKIKMLAFLRTDEILRV